MIVRYFSGKLDIAFITVAVILVLQGKQVSFLGGQSASERSVGSLHGVRGF